MPFTRFIAVSLCSLLMVMLFRLDPARESNRSLGRFCLELIAMLLWTGILSWGGFFDLFN